MIRKILTFFSTIIAFLPIVAAQNSQLLYDVEKQLEKNEPYKQSLFIHEKDTLLFNLSTERNINDFSIKLNKKNAEIQEIDENHYLLTVIADSSMVLHLSIELIDKKREFIKIRTIRKRGANNPAIINYHVRQKLFHDTVTSTYKTDSITGYKTDSISESLRVCTDIVPVIETMYNQFITLTPNERKNITVKMPDKRVEVDGFEMVLITINMQLQQIKWHDTATNASNLAIMPAIDSLEKENNVDFGLQYKANVTANDPSALLRCVVNTDSLRPLYFVATKSFDELQKAFKYEPFFSIFSGATQSFNVVTIPEKKTDKIFIGMKNLDKQYKADLHFSIVAEYISPKCNNREMITKIVTKPLTKKVNRSYQEIINMLEWVNY